MNTEQLFKHYVSVFDSPNAISKLRTFILESAVRGKLVEQNPNDESADKLLDRITSEKAKLMETGVIKKQESSRDNLTETPFAIPNTWKWVMLESVFQYDAGKKCKPDSLDPNLWLLELKDVEKNSGCLLARVRVSERNSKSTKSEFQVGDILYGKLRPYLNKVIVADQSGYSTTEIVALRPYFPLCSEYCALVLRSPYFVSYVTRLGQGTKMPRLRTIDAKVAAFPLPPLPEQQLIVDTVNGLLEHCDQFEEAQFKRDSKRKVFTLASLASLNECNIELLEFKKRANFVRANFDRLTISDDQINLLRQTVIDMAVSGRLVEQDPNEEQVSKLLDEFAVEKCSRIDRGEMKLGKAMSEIELTPFSIPPGWMWLPLGETGHIFNGNSTNVETKNRLAKIREGYPYIMTRDVGYGFDSINYDSGFKVSTNDIRFKVARPFSVLVCAEGGSAGRKIGMTDRAICFGNKLLVNEMWEGINSYFLLLVYMSSYFFDEFESRMSGVIPGISISKFKQVPFPLPPKLEQHRIVKKVNELMMCCEKLETALVTRQNTKASLLNSVFHEVLSSVGDNLNKLHS